MFFEKILESNYSSQKLARFKSSDKEPQLSIDFITQDIIPIMVAAYLSEAKRKYPIENDGELLAQKYNRYLVNMMMLRVSKTIAFTVLNDISD
jgi:hypothetical protein